MSEMSANSQHRPAVPVRSALAAALVAVLALSGCGADPTPGQIDDPHEAQNRDFHEFNLQMDRAVLRPVARGYVQAVPQPVAIGISNFASNLDLPGEVVNDLLQLKLGDATQNTVRFLINSTVGLGGLMDPAGKAGVPEMATDFGETLHVWGMPEGAYIELPVLGPTTDRDLLGTVVDYVSNPVRMLVPPPRYYINTAARLARKIGDRGRYSDTVDSLLYDSADGYAQTRLLYLQNRRFELGQSSAGDDVEDPYAQ